MITDFRESKGALLMVSCLPPCISMRGKMHFNQQVVESRLQGTNKRRSFDNIHELLLVYVTEIESFLTG